MQMSSTTRGDLATPWQAYEAISRPLLGLRRKVRAEKSAAGQIVLAAFYWLVLAAFPA
jgi:hypothetical protein